MSAAKATGSPWKLPPDSASGGSPTDQRIVRYAVRLGLQGRCRVAKNVERGAHDLWLAAQAIGILHAIIAGEMRGTDRAAGDQCAQGAGNVDLPSMAAQRMDAGIEWRIGTACGIGRQSTGYQAGLQQRFRLEQPRERIGRGKLRSVQQRKPLLGAKHDRLHAGLRQCRGGGLAFSRVLISPTPIIAAAMWANGARSPDAPTEPCVGTTGNRSCDNIAARNCTVSSRAPEAPCPRLASFNASMSRTSGAGMGSPTPAACDNTMLRWSVARSAGSIRMLARRPNPVLMP